MSSKVTFTKQEINWLALIPKLFVIGILSICFYQLDKQAYFVIALLFYFMLTLLAKMLFLPNSLYVGIKLLKQAKFEQAIVAFEETIDYYSKYPWIDKYRFLLLISSSKRTISESSICNLAFCYLQIAEVKRAKEIYEYVLQRYPENPNARGMLRTINLISSAKID